MDLHLWLLYVAVVSAVIATPGPAALLCVQHGLRHGVRGCLPTILGGTLSCLLLMAASMLGVAQLLSANAALLSGVRCAGAAYLFWLGASALRVRQKPATVGAARVAAGSAGRLRQGFLVGIGNPKDIVFFASLFPHFVDAGQPWPARCALLFATWAAIDLVAMLAYAAAGRRLRPLAVRPQWAERGAGVVFMSIAGWLLVQA
jgi:threonine/homoserine/homoserine lactone efflux protein